MTSKSPKQLFFGPTRDEYTNCSDDQLVVETEEEYDDGRRRFVYASLSSWCSNGALGDRAEDPERLELIHVVVRYYNAFVFATQDDQSFDNSDAAYVAGLPEGYYTTEPICCEDLLVPENEAFERGYTVYDFIGDWLHLGADRHHHPTYRGDQRGRKRPLAVALPTATKR